MVLPDCDTCTHAHMHTHTHTHNLTYPEGNQEFIEIQAATSILVKMIKNLPHIL